MTLAALAFAAGAAALQLQPGLPSLFWLLLIPPLVFAAYQRRRFVVPCAFAVGFAWAAVLAHVRMADWLSPELENRDLDVVGVVSSLPALSERAVRFEFEVESAKEGLPKKLLLGCDRCAWSEEGAARLNEPVLADESCCLTATLGRQP